jgi:hypothetical protein
MDYANAAAACTGPSTVVLSVSSVLFCGEKTYTHTVFKIKKNSHTGVQIDYNVVHLRTSSVQLFILLLQNFE